MSKTRMIKLFNSLQYKYDTYTIFSDFVELSALSINSAVEIIKRSEDEKRYKQIQNKYPNKAFKIFPELFAELVDELESNCSDVLGELFMELDLGSSAKGQFFTPYSLCKATADMALQDMDKIILENGYISVNEPCVGGGAMIIAIYEIMRREKFNPQKQLMVYAQDLDLKAVYMSYVQLSLLGIPAVIKHMNTLSLEEFNSYKTPFWILGGWDFRKPKSKYKVNGDGQIGFEV